jgi:hypothetical protein
VGVQQLESVEQAFVEWELALVVAPSVAVAAAPSEAAMGRAE